ncbi:TldD/PmbA family protein, partial [bacterium]|nr:TldD/PmbA family protein [candidate division CSSED10-310 bacterium]
GYAASVDLNRNEAIRVGRLAAELAAAAAGLAPRAIRLAPATAAVARWVTPARIDPGAIPVPEKQALLQSAIAMAETVRGVNQVSGSIGFRRLETWMGSSDGARIEQMVLIPSIELSIGAGERTDAQTRSWPSSHGGFTCTGGYERLQNVIQADSICRAAEEAVALVHAPPCPEGVVPLILAPDQMSMQIHESIGHPLELDRVYGVETNFSGTSFAQPERLNTPVFGSTHVTVVTDPTEAGVLGGYGFDDDGVPATSVTVIRNGRLMGYLSGRETAARLGTVSSGNNRAADWRHYPINRMSNTRMEPGSSSWDDLLAGAEGGLLMATNRSWSIDDRRDSFRFECEAAWEIKGGQRGTLYRNPSYSGRTMAFWASCEAVGVPSLYENWGTPSCGKGEPAQSIHTSQGAAPARFSSVPVAPSGHRKGHPHG